MVVAHTLPGIDAGIVHKLAEMGKHGGLGCWGQVMFGSMPQISKNELRNRERVIPGGFAGLTFVDAVVGPGH